jgi:hypothetical protein
MKNELESRVKIYSDKIRAPIGTTQFSIESDKSACMA